MFITKRVFDPALVGEAVHIIGKDIGKESWNRNFLIKNVMGESIELVNSEGATLIVHMNSFDNHDPTSLKLTILERPTVNGPIIDPIRASNTLKRVAKIGRMNRGSKERVADNDLLESILRRNMIPMPLYRIIARMHSAGHKHWTNNNAAGFVRSAIKDGYRVKKVQYGVYAYDSREGE